MFFHDKIAKLSRGSIPFFPATRFKEVRMTFTCLAILLLAKSPMPHARRRGDRAD